MNKRNTRNKNKGLFVILLLVLIFVTGGFAWYINANNVDPYAIYNVYQKETKNAGELQHIKEHEKEQYYVSLYYPEFDDTTLQETIQTYIEKVKQSDALSNNQIVYVDYDARNVFDHYISLTFHKTVYSEAGVAIDEEDTYYNYDLKAKKMLTIRDVLRRDYMDKLKEEAVKVNIRPEEIKMENLHNFQLDETGVTFNLDEKTLTLAYKENKAYMRLTNKNIPSLYQKDPILPEKQKVDPNKPMIAITFDDGPHLYNTKRIMDEFDKYNGKATFFMLGTNALENPDIIAQIYKRGFQLGNHSWDHSMRIAASYDNPMNEKEVRDEIYKTQDVIFEAAGFDASYFRPPYGALNDTVRNVSTLDFAMWNIDSEDWSSKDPATITNMIEANAHDGAVVLLHDIYDTTFLAVQKFLPMLVEKGYQFVTIDTLMEHRKDTLTASNSIIMAPSNLEEN